MSSVDAAPVSSLTSHNDSANDILDHDSLSAPHHALLPTHDHQAIDLDLACLARSDPALEDPSGLMALHSRDHLFGDMGHVGDHVKDNHITMVEAVDPAVIQQDPQQQSPESSLELKRVKVSFACFSYHPWHHRRPLLCHLRNGRAIIPTTC